jgi:hypothetical protein
MANNYLIFVSHSWDYVDDLKKLRGLLEARGYFNVEFTEVPPHDAINSDNSTYVKSVLKKKILDSNIMLAMAGIYASHSDWMAWEIKTAKDNRIPIVGVIPRGQERLSKVVTENSVADVGWNTESIVAAIRAHSK